MDLRTELATAYRTGDFLQTVYKCSVADRDDRKVVASELAAMHNEGIIDVVGAFGNLRNDPSSGADFFLTRDVFEKALAAISAPITSVMQCVLHLYQEAGQDLVAGTIVSAYNEFCERSPSRPREALEEIEKRPEHYSGLLSATIAAGATTDTDYFVGEAIRLCSHPNLDLRIQAVFSLGTLKWQGGTSISKSLFSALERITTENTDDRVLAGVIRSTFSLLQRDKSEEQRAVSLIASALSKGQQFALHAASEVFGFHSGDLSPFLLAALVSHLRHASPENGATVRNIDFGISHLLKTTSATEGIVLFEELLLANRDKLNVETFPTTAQVIRDDGALFSRILTRWFSRGVRVLCKGIETLAESHHADNLELQIEPAELQPSDAIHKIFVARKVVGYLFLKPVSAASALISLMRLAGDAKVLAELARLVLDPLLVNFTGSLRQYVVQRSQRESGQVKDALEATVKALDEYLIDLRSVGDIPALHPSGSHQAAFQRYFSRQLSESFKAAQAKSVFLNLVSRSVVLHGRKAVQYVRGPEGSRRVDMEFKKLGTEIEVPRLQQLDPFGLDYMLRVFRVEQRQR